MNIDDFLLARYAEVEARAQKLVAHARENREQLDDPYFLGRRVPGWHDWDDVEILATEAQFLLAANRRIIELHDARGRNILGQPVCRSCGPALEPVPCPTLRQLAVEFYMRVDYRAEWRP